MLGVNSFFHMGSFAEIQHIYASVSGLKDKFVDLSKESARHRQV